MMSRTISAILIMEERTVEGFACKGRDVTLWQRTSKSAYLKTGFSLWLKHDIKLISLLLKKEISLFY